MPSDQPNIILISTDQQRFDTAGDAAPSWMRTPHYDHLCNEGVEFTRAYADCPICVPARTSIMTGKFTTTHHMSNNGETSDVMGREGTLPTVLRELGYQTAAIGKMHFGPERTRHGFDEMILPADYYNEMQRSGNPLQPMRHGLGQNELYPTMATVPEALTLTNWTAQRSLEYIRERRDPTVPFFLWCSFAKPHPPLDPPEPYYSMYRDCPIPDPVYGEWSEDGSMPEAMKRQQQQWSLDRVPPEVIRAARVAYYGLITQIDYNMGRVFAALQDLGMSDNALICYTSDHGEFLGDHHTGCKVFHHEPAAHVPFVLRMPKSWPDRHHGDKVKIPVTHADILPTLVAAAGGTPADDVDGMNLIDLARGRIAQPRQYVETTAGLWPDGLFYFGITDGRWKYAWFPEGDAEQLFDIETDPHELINCAGRPECEPMRTKLRAELLRLHVARNSPYVKGGDFVGRPLVGDSERDRRNNFWAGYHTENYDVDVRH